MPKVGSLWRFSSRPTLFGEEGGIYNYWLMSPGAIMVVIDGRKNKFGRVKVLSDGQIGYINGSWFASGVSLHGDS